MFGFNDRVEILNGRLAMLGFVAAVGAYALTGQVIPGVWWFMTTTNSKKVKEEFLYPTPSINPDSDVSFLDIALINNLNSFSHHVSYLTNMAIGGKIEPDHAYKEIKKLYNAMKQSHKSLQGSWF